MVGWGKAEWREQGTPPLEPGGVSLHSLICVQILAPPLAVAGMLTDPPVSSPMGEGGGNKGACEGLGAAPGSTGAK